MTGGMNALTVQERLLLLAILFLLVFGASVRYCRYQNPPSLPSEPTKLPHSVES